MATVKISFQGDTSQLKKSVADVQNQINSLNKTSGSGGLNLSNALGIGAAVTGVLALKNALGGLGNIIGDASKKAAGLETLTVQLKVLTGSMEKAKKLVADISTYAGNTPFQQEPIQQSVKTLLSFGIAAEDVVSVIKLLGDVSDADGEKLKRLATIFGKVSSANKMMADDLNQLIDAGFNPAQEMTDKMGISVSELRDRMSKGQIGIADLQAALVTATSAGGRFNGMLAELSKTTAGKYSNFIEVLDQLKIAFGTGFNVGLKDVLDSATLVSEEFKGTFEAIGKAAGELLTVLAAKLPDLVDDIKAVFEGKSTIWDGLKDGFLTVLNADEVKTAVETLGTLLIPKILRDSFIADAGKTLLTGTKDLTSGGGTPGSILASMAILGKFIPGPVGAIVSGGGLASIGAAAMNNTNDKETSNQKITDKGVTLAGVAMMAMGTYMLKGLMPKIAGTLLQRHPLGTIGAAGFATGYGATTYALNKSDYMGEWERSKGGPITADTENLTQAINDFITSLPKDIVALQKTFNENLTKGEKSRADMQKLIKEAEISALDADIKELSRLAYETLSLQEKAPKFPISEPILQDPLEAFFANPPQGKVKTKSLDLFKPFINSMQAMGGGKIFGGVDPVSIARDSLNQLKIIARNTSRTYAVAG